MLLAAAWASGAPMAPRADAALAPALDDAFAVVPAGLLRKLQLIHIPKTGGGTLEDVGFKHGVKWGKYREDWPGGNCPRGCPRTWQPCSGWHIPPPVFKHLSTREDPYEGYHTFCAVRHPFRRAISEYLWTGGECSAEGLNSAVHSVLGQINATIHTLVQDFPSIPPDMLEAASKVKYPGMGRKFDKDSDASSDCHWLPQWLYTKDSCGTILRTESLMADFKAMMKLWGHQINGSEMRSATFSHSNFKRTGCELAVGALDARSVQLLTTVYRKDFEDFSYDANIQPDQASSVRHRSPKAARKSLSRHGASARSKHSALWRAKHGSRKRRQGQQQQSEGEEGEMDEGEMEEGELEEGELEEGELEEGEMEEGEMEEGELEEGEMEEGELVEGEMEEGEMEEGELEEGEAGVAGEERLGQDPKQWQQWQIQWQKDQQQILDERLKAAAASPAGRLPSSSDVIYTTRSDLVDAAD